MEMVDWMKNGVIPLVEESENFQQQTQKDKLCDAFMGKTTGESDGRKYKGKIGRFDHIKA